MEYKNVQEAMSFHKKLYKILSILSSYNDYMPIRIDQLKEMVIRFCMFFDADVKIQGNCFLCDYAANACDPNEPTVSRCDKCPVYTNDNRCYETWQPYYKATEIFAVALSRPVKKFTEEETEKLRALFREISELEIRGDYYDKRHDKTMGQG